MKDIPNLWSASNNIHEIESEIQREQESDGEMWISTVGALDTKPKSILESWSFYKFFCVELSEIST